MNDELYSALSIEFNPIITFLIDTYNRLFNYDRLFPRDKTRLFELPIDWFYVLKVVELFKISSFINNHMTCI
jgi:hypothetical protein